MRTMRTMILAIFIPFIFTGCWLMPYQENFTCNADIGSGSCGMVRDNYYGDGQQNKLFKYTFDEHKSTLVTQITKVEDDCSKYADNLDDFHKCNQKYEYLILRKKGVNQ